MAGVDVEANGSGVAVNGTAVKGDGVANEDLLTGAVGGKTAFWGVVKTMSK